MNRLVECVPNFSEGRDETVIHALAEALESVEGVKLLHVDMGCDANRTVMTFVAPPEAAVEGGLRVMKTAAGLIDMRKQRGVHRRMGATDVFPFIPFRNITDEECVQAARTLASRAAETIGIPIYMYGKAASAPERVRLPDLRKGGYEALASKLQDPRFSPDFGDAVFHPAAGAAVIGVRDFLLAYNVNLETADASAAKHIAREIRESGTFKRDARGKRMRGPDGKLLRVPGRLAACQADGWFLPEYGCAQVTMNLLDMTKTGLFEAFQAVKAAATDLGTAVNGSELIGLSPARALTDAGRKLLSDAEASDVTDQGLIETAIEGLGLNARGAFTAADRVLEYAFESRIRLSMEPLPPKAP